MASIQKDIKRAGPAQKRKGKSGGGGGGYYQEIWETQGERGRRTDEEGAHEKEQRGPSVERLAERTTRGGKAQEEQYERQKREPEQKVQAEKKKQEGHKVEENR